MNQLLNPIRFLVYSNCWIGLGAAAFTWQYYFIYNLAPDYALICFAFFATVLTYTFQRYVKIRANTRVSGNRIKWMISHPILVKLILVISTTGTVFSLIGFNLISYMILLVMGTISVFYVIRIPGKSGRNLRDIPSLKIFLIALVWSATASFLPYINLPETHQEVPWVLFLADFIFLIAITIPFDIRDIELDELEKKTIPQLVGERNAIWISLLLLLISYGILCGIMGEFMPFTFVSLIISMLVIWGSHKHREDLYFSFIVDGLLLIQPLLVLPDTLKTAI